MVKILLVEDNELNRDMLSRRLKRRGYEVAIAKDGLEGLSRATSEQPDLILMDMSLPQLDGWEVTQKLKADDHTRSIPIIALTAHAMVGDREKTLAAGCDDYDTKPVDLKRLLQKIEALVTNPITPINAKVAAKQPVAVATQAPESVIFQPIISQPSSTFPDVAAPIANSMVESPALNHGVAPADHDAEVARLLIVDDIEENRDMLSRRLQRRGYSIIDADSGETALDIISREKLDLVMLDIMMPGIDGLKTLQRIRQSYSQVQLPVIMVTAKDQNDEIARAFELGANDYITKPIDFTIAMARIQAQLTTLQASRQERKQVIHQTMQVYNQQALQTNDPQQIQ
ncbi:MAG: response regulator, partial [Cyanothece sp. SIO1E1]|nr:response regulator [Cyanothece sp. SIO1E1]